MYLIYNKWKANINERSINNCQKKHQNPYTFVDLRQLDRLPESDTAVIAKQLLGGGAGAIGVIGRWKGEKVEGIFGKVESF